jgi:single-strand DNA-binding protein
MRVGVSGRLEQRSWETDSGDKRNKIEIVADFVGPSLEWATAVVTKNEKRDGAVEEKNYNTYAADERPF